MDDKNSIEGSDVKERLKKFISDKFLPFSELETLKDSDSFIEK